ncbi:NYN domain-containing protein [Bradyrhizobium sp. LTSPM299]|uniref:LabA-like NYN domain-containing protein n=1 Tax=Bradyrhizobium sp. LTSPM299 TaxID=1619233 RepID=UPI001FD94674|nr:NYN domain-containing protein [Bradyrhizobium sp. LTSPM299]
MFIDGVNLHASARALGFDIDYRRLLERFKGHGTLLRAFYYPATEDQEYTSLRPLIDWLSYNGYSVVTGSNKGCFDASGRRKTKSSMEIELAVNAMELAGHLDQMVLFSGDSAFRRLVEAMQRRGVRVTVVSTVASRPMTAADELRRQADAFIDLADLRPVISRRIPAPT